MKTYTYGLIYKDVEENISVAEGYGKYNVIMDFIHKHKLNNRRGFKSWDVRCEILQIDGKDYIHTASF